ncbi:MAG: hypothetical protein A2X28_04430 [Elusimicrobia bacterium GWA2_56_46]|nr:MAG: hypothetical protein A2X28_04430 [Elusimicrobia bacterium GWA2_56_46]OGR56123.1 MAG: hypothetical protein A2X39_07850 [Elusimicrobia bacterium GWC2_56_31]HBW23105.1 hypothetical protein [Elusimicrobiota bacterium]
MNKKLILTLSLVFAASGAHSAGGKIPWGEPGYAVEFRYLEEMFPGEEKAWRELEGGEQEDRLSSVREAAHERSRQVGYRYYEMVNKWDLAKLKECGQGDASGDIRAFQIWQGKDRALWFRQKLDAVRGAAQKTQTRSLTAEEGAALEPYLQPGAISALRHARLYEESLPKGPPRDYMETARSATGLRYIATSSPGRAEQKDLSRFYDGSKAAGSTDGQNGASYAGISGFRPLVAAPRSTSASTVRHSAPESLPGMPGGADKRVGPDKKPAVAAAKRADGRGLTPDMVAAARKIYGDKIDYSKVEIITGKDMGLWGKLLTSGGFNVTWGNTIYLANDENGNPVHNFAKAPDILIHEMCHVYQYQKDGWGYATGAVREHLAEGNAYSYQIWPGKEFGEYGVEQQARIIQEYYAGAIAPSVRPEVERMLRKEGLLYA